jgi:hypothetical protein
VDDIDLGNPWRVNPTFPNSQDCAVTNQPHAPSIPLSRDSRDFVWSLLHTYAPRAWLVVCNRIMASASGTAVRPIRVAVYILLPMRERESAQSGPKKRMSQEFGDTHVSTSPHIHTHTEREGQQVPLSSSSAAKYSSVRTGASAETPCATTVSLSPITILSVQFLLASLVGVLYLFFLLFIFSTWPTVQHRRFFFFDHRCLFYFLRGLSFSMLSPLLFIFILCGVELTNDALDYHWFFCLTPVAHGRTKSGSASTLLIAISIQSMMVAFVLFSAPRGW